MLPLPNADDDDDDAAAAAAANSNGFDVIVIPELLFDDDIEPFPFVLIDELPPPAPFSAFDADETGCGRRGNRSNCWRAACQKFKK